MLAFIINVGLFVKAKINLQNATDAAAFSGAATQARQLTNIAYANWELRNTYKEWMFKYYILGELGLVGENFLPAKIAGNSIVDFTLPTPTISGVKDFDKYNMPSICIHNNSKTNICSKYALPGIPRFDAIGVAGISEVHEAFVSELVAQKGEDCSRRTKMNYATALSWAYGSGMDIVPDAPLVATNRPGAWPEALELAFRIRNLEMIANRPPAAGLTRSTIENLRSQASDIGLNERPVKAFWSAYRNLGGGTYKDNITGSGTVDELAANFKLTEIAPQYYDSRANGRETVSSFLIPDTFDYPVAGGGKATWKYYVDLQMMPVNYATMFSTFVNMSNTNDAIGGVKAEATCGVSKTALPVPGYILGFNKNPQVLTYYAVKGESKFIGLFFPILSGDSEKGITLTAYSAAKPFGGRIGPKLFKYEEEQRLVGRADTDNRSASYISGLKLKIGTDFVPGSPIPSSPTFWISKDSDALGGLPGANKDVAFGIPNMIYDFGSEDDLKAQKNAISSLLQIIDEIVNINFSKKERLGLYHAPQFRYLMNSIGTVSPGTSMSGTAVERALVRSRRPTKYEAINYLVPDFRETSDKNNTAPTIQRLNQIPGGFTYKLFAPLMGDNLLYKTQEQVETVLGTYLQANEGAVKQYLQAVLDVANSIYALKDTNKDPNSTIASARSIHANAGKGKYDYKPDKLNDADCKLDLASKFSYFFNPTITLTACGVTPLRKTMVDFITKHSENINGFDRKLFYLGQYSDPTPEGSYRSPAVNLVTPEQLMTAYYPGKRQGTVGEKGIAEHPLRISSATAGSDSYSTKRNSYSTKFIQLAKVMDSPPGGSNATTGIKDYAAEPALREAMDHKSDDLIGNLIMQNPIKYNDPELNNIYYLDF